MLVFEEGTEGTILGVLQCIGTTILAILLGIVIANLYGSNYGYQQVSPMAIVILVAYVLGMVLIPLKGCP